MINIITVLEHKSNNLILGFNNFENCLNVLYGSWSGDTVKKSHSAEQSSIHDTRKRRLSCILYRVL